jgi:aldose 1-epimerase
MQQDAASRTPEWLVLESQSARLTLDPRRGGAIREFTWRGENVLRPTPADAGNDPFDMACFPMVPFVNRVASGRFTFGEHAVQLERNWAEDPHPLHGHGWRGPWQIVAAATSSATVRFEGRANDWPWRYAAEQRFQLLDDGLLVELSIENLSDEPMPAMLGLHPYFPDAANARVRAVLPRVWLTDTEVLPVREARTPSDWSFDAARPIRAVAIDNSFSGWNGTASITWPRRSVTLNATHCGFLHVYAPAGRDFFCLEPQTAAPGALGRNAGEPTVIPPGQRFAIRVQFVPGVS